MLGVTVVGVLLSPAIIAVSAVVDLAKRRVRLPTVRVALFLLQYGMNDSVEIPLAPVYWVRAGFGTPLDTPTSIARHERLQHWSIAVLARRAERLLGLSLEIDSASMAALTPGPVFTDLAKAVPLRDPIRITAGRIPVDRIPTGDAERIAWLDEQWLQADRWIGDQQ